MLRQSYVPFEHLFLLFEPFHIWVDLLVHLLEFLFNSLGFLAFSMVRHMLGKSNVKLYDFLVILGLLQVDKVKVFSSGRVAF